eukprot:13705-Heterococcus_DN1.PRE.2
MQGEETPEQVAARLEALLAAAEALLSKPKWLKFSTLIRCMKDAPSEVEVTTSQYSSLSKSSRISVSHTVASSDAAVAKLEIHEQVTDAAHTAHADAQLTLIAHTDTESQCTL